MAVTDTTQYTQRDGEWGYYKPDGSNYVWTAAPDFEPADDYSDPYGTQAQFQGSTYMQNPEGDWGQFTAGSGGKYSWTAAPDYFVAPTSDSGSSYETPTLGDGDISQITAQEPRVETEIGIEDYAGQVAHDPDRAFSNEMLLSGSTPEYSQDQIDSGLVSDQPGMDADQYSASAAQGGTATAQDVDPQNTATYEAASMFDDVEDMEAAQGELSDGGQIDADGLVTDTEAHAAGDTELGKALKDFAFLDLDNVDARATLKGQLDLFQEEFVDSEGNPTIPSWASGAARNTAKIAAFKGITGTAATAAMAQAIMESSIQVAEQDAKFYQTVSLTNLNNEQQSLIQRAGILANMDLANVDARTAAAVNNAKQFLAMDLANLDNRQQEQVINSQQRFQALFEDTRQENAARLFGAESENDMSKFYDTLTARMREFNAAQTNAMTQFNTTESNDMSRFNSTLSDSRDKFYREMSYAIDLDNAQWRQEVATTETQMQFEAAAFDARNMVDMSTEQLSRLWDRADALIDYTWKTAENDADRDTQLAISQLQAETNLATAKISAKTSKSVAKTSADAQDKNNWWEVAGTVAGALIAKW